MPETLSYRHESHAGNHGDVLKHVAYLAVLRDMLMQYPTGVTIVDTHAGTGLYNLERQAKQECEQGIKFILSSSASRPAIVQDYVDTVRRFNDSTSVNQSSVSLYPGSPALAKLLLRKNDDLILFEWNQREFEKLRSFVGVDPRIQVHQQDGYAGLVSLLLPSKPTLILVDPPYKHKSEYDQIMETLVSLLNAYSPTLRLLLWLPHDDDPRATEFETQVLELLKARAASYTFMSLQVASKGLLGSSVLLLGPLHDSLQAELREAGEYLCSTLKQDGADVKYRCFIG